MRIGEYRKLSAAEGLAAELLALEAGEEALLLWEAESLCAVLPRTESRDDVLWDVPALRRESGGGAVLLGPGCLNYALMLSLERRPELYEVERSYRVILGVVLAGLGLKGARVIGSDLVLGNRKFGGSAQRRIRGGLLHHGTLLYGFELQDIGRFLREPVRRPAYRRGRTHAEFVVNAPLTLPALLACFHRVASSWSSAPPTSSLRIEEP